ncbi:unnamed protein product [Rotaria magnacalcarata]|uniref:Uncharacterized protein n=1 Tax=Rotaria magnacalcarata TaxID=392030 RepID=A0A816N0B4_9BILA|nr:unnamed protein product [Rotaria magnacalcarata]CAF1632554.1 unnamed protein product [Rotaria magnacalcarata]CAF2027851.1 unnamed protein product [Rotaria magnacalcarata]CAF2070546.1 unnamed protein product [Rotaria magnacalcarata]CAF2140522.1 unnamed protein product [Rotaria magnacalcarata]
MVIGITGKTGSRLFSRYDVTNSAVNRERLSFNAAVFMSIIGIGVSLFSTNKLCVASSSTQSILTRSK